MPDPDDIEVPGQEALSSPDEYEAFMQGDGKALYRQKMSWPWYFQLLFPLLMIMGLVNLALQGAPLFAFLLLFGAMTFAWAMFHALRVAVTREHVFLQYGLIGPKIKVEDIVHCEAETYNFWRYGGYGLRYSITDGSWAFNMVGDKGKAVRIHYKTRFGGVRKIVVSSEHPHVLADAINRARRAKGHDVPAESRLSDAELGIDSALDQLDADAPIFEEHHTLPETTVQEEVSATQNQEVSEPRQTSE